jgi:hypothetical protein
MAPMPTGVLQAQLWRLSADRRTVRACHCRPLRVAGLQKPVDIHLDFEAEAVDEVLQRLTELRAQMQPPPVLQRVSKSARMRAARAAGWPWSAMVLIQRTTPAV